MAYQVHRSLVRARTLPRPRRRCGGHGYLRAWFGLGPRPEPMAAYLAPRWVGHARNLKSIAKPIVQIFVRNNHHTTLLYAR